MEQIFLSLLSGTIGAIIGAFITFRINNSNHKAAAIEKMLSIVFSIGFKTWWGEDPQHPDWKADSQPSLIFHENYSKLWNAYAALRAALPPWKRKGLDKAWQKYMVMEDYYDQLPEDEISKVFQKGTHKTREEAVKESGEFVRFLIELR